MRRGFTTWASAGLAMLLALGGCSRVRVSSDFDPATDFAPLRTWAWAERPDAGAADGRVPDQLRDARIVRAVEALLVERGYPRVDAGAADFLVAYHVTFDDRFEYADVPAAVGYWGYWGGFYGTRTYVDQYEERSLLIDVLAPGGEVLLWRGVGVERVRDYSSPQRREENIRAVVTAILARFPPPAER